MKHARLLAALVLVNAASLHGATVERFEIDGHAVTLTRPDHVASGKPWLWVGEFPGHLKSLEDGLVGEGWHIAYVNVSNRFGSPRAMVVWEKLYAELHEARGLSPKPALLGISRGGLYVNAWTRLHPERVSVLCLDNAVCDVRSWPGGFQLTAKGSGSPKDWALYKQEFGFASDEDGRANAIQATDGLAPAVRAGGLLVAVYGTADTVVPYVDNARLLVEFWAAAGGRYRLFPKSGGDHHPHGLADPKPLIELLCVEASRPAGRASARLQRRGQ